jgi:hypothetical protein
VKELLGFLLLIALALAVLYGLALLGTPVF